MERKTEEDVVMRTWKTEMVRPCGEKDRGRCSNENIEDWRWLGDVERKTEQDVVMRTWKTEMVRTCGEKDRARCSNENMED